MIDDLSVVKDTCRGFFDWKFHKINFNAISKILEYLVLIYFQFSILLILQLYKVYYLTMNLMEIDRLIDKKIAWKLAIYLHKKNVSYFLLLTFLYNHPVTVS